MYPFCFSACKEVKCDTKKFQRCYETFNVTEDARCDCLPAYVSINGSCITAPVIVEVVAFKLNRTYKAEFSDLNDPKTKEFTEPLEQALWVTLGLSPQEFVKVTNLTEGSVFADFIVLMKNDSTENETTVYEKLNAEVKTNQTGSLVDYFPVAEQIVVVVGK